MTLRRRKRAKPLVRIPPEIIGGSVLESYMARSNLLSDDALQELLALIRQADSVELKLALP